MKSILMRVGFLTCLMLMSCSYEETFAESTWSSKCASYGEIKPNQNPTFQHMNCLLTNAALEAKIPPEVVKAVATKENGGWKQFDENGQPVISEDKGIGLMQITNQSSYDQEKLNYDINYNIQAGVEILSSMYHRTDLPKIKETGPEVIENWYFPVMAYNGTKPSNSPLYQSSGLKNKNAYQELVFALIEKESYINDTKIYDTKLGQFPFKTADFEYDPNSRKNIVFRKMEYTLTDQMHASAYQFQIGDKVMLTEEKVNLRSQPSTSSVAKALAINTTLIIEGNFLYDQSLTSKNQFVWYPVKTEDQKLAGYISSAYITKKLDVPLIYPVDDNDLFLSGKTPANVTIQIMNGSVLIGSSVADANRYFKSRISAQKAGAQLRVLYKDKLNARSPSKTITVSDKTAPVTPSVSKVNNKATIVTGKTEANAIVSLTIAGKSYSAKVDGNGNYKVTIPVQNTGTSISVTAKDGARNVSTVKTVTVVRAAPNMPSVNTVNNKTTTVTGKTEANATVTVTIIGKAYRAKVDASGNYKVAIPVQKAVTSISVSAKDKVGNVSAARTAKVTKVAPNMPTVNPVKSSSTTVTGKSEKDAIVTVKIGTKVYTVKANVSGDYKVYIPKQKAGIKLYVNAKDTKRQVSATRTITVSK